jgi:hypothetical protein
LLVARIIFLRSANNLFLSAKKGDALMGGSAKGGMKGEVRGRKPKPLKKKEREES